MEMDLPGALRAFDRRERGLVVAWALDRIGFSIGYEFRTQLGDALPDSCSPVSADAFAAMDYEMRWLHGALAASIGQTEGSVAQTVADGYVAQTTANKQESMLPPLPWTNEDVDLLVAYSKESGVELLMIEAKGYTSWDANQIAHKKERLRAMFGEDGRRFPEVCPHLVFVGPVPPSKGSTAWPQWMLADNEPVFIPLPQPTGQKYRVARKSASEDKWRTESVKWPGT
jgi:hypothetical protein